jgi:MOSC N-terminal beta barrel domain
MKSILENNRFGIVVGTTLTIVLISSRQRVLKRIANAILGRFQLYMYILPKTVKDSCNNNNNTNEDVTTTDDTSSNYAVITGLYYYPVKSLRAVPMDVAVLGTKGFVGDRQYMIVRPAPLPLWGSFGPDDATHRFVTQRQCPILTQISVLPIIDNNTLQFSNQINSKILNIPSEPNPTNPIYRSTIWDDIVMVQDMGNDIADYITEIIHQDTSLPEEYKNITSFRLVMHCHEDYRLANDNYIPGSARNLVTGNGPIVSLSDGFPMYVSHHSFIFCLLVFFFNKIMIHIEKSRVFFRVIGSNFFFIFLSFSLSFFFFFFLEKKNTVW